jgi:hypothetical protein
MPANRRCGSDRDDTSLARTSPSSDSHPRLPPPPVLDVAPPPEAAVTVTVAEFDALPLLPVQLRV